MVCFVLFAVFSAFLVIGGVKSDETYSTEALADEVLNLPGAENLEFSFRHFSGYLPISETKRMHYWFVESTGSREKDPITFWTNGGPGCSGMLGFLTEQGPFRVQGDLTLKLNPHSWNSLSNMFFVEQPCGVGFSYSLDDRANSTDYRIGDDQAAIDNYNTIQEFFKRFPQYRSNDLYIASESYGGHVRISFLFVFC
jgi:cathepsin A (carboxypeptidase C)